MLLLLMPLPGTSDARAASSGHALLIGNDRSNPGNHGNGCAQTVTAIQSRLEQLGLAVKALVNLPPTNLRDALDAFADEVGGVQPGAAAMGAHLGATLIYVCAPAAAKGSRLFVMPSGTGGGTADAQTQGIVLQALLNVLAGTNGTLYADLLVNGDAADRQVPRLPGGLHLALNKEAEAQAPLIGTALSATGFPFDQDWTAIVDALRPIDAGLVVTPTPASSAPVLDPPPPERPAPAPASSAETQDRPPPTSAPPKPASGFGAVSGAAPAPANPHDGPGGERRNRRPRPVVAPPKPDLPVSVRTARIEAALARHGSYTGPIDGKYTPAVIEAVRSFQRQLGNPLSGFLTQAEIVRLLNS
jgi:peptidoglycan hydrolase-like protein with peptidoglycan-binding domain